MDEHATSNYHTDTEWTSKSQLELFYDDPDMYRRVFVDRSMPAPQVGIPALVGKAIHHVLLEGGDLSDMLVIVPPDCLRTDGGINRKRLDDWLAGDERQPVKAANYDDISACVRAALSSELGQMIKEGAATEHEIYADVAGFPAKCRVDILHGDGDRYSIHDVKCSTEISDRAFLRSARNYRYWMQDSHYSTVVESALGLEHGSVRFWFWTIETAPPYRIHARRYDDLSRQLARDEWRMTVDALQECRRTGMWEHGRAELVSIKDWELKYSNQDVTWSAES